jgi:hypothetical protein
MIPQIGDLSPHTSSTLTFPTTRDHAPFILPIPKPLIDLYQLRDDTTRTIQQEALLALQQLHDTNQVTTDHIDKAAKHVVDVIENYYLLVKQKWPMAQPSTTETNTKRHPYIPKSDTRRRKRTTRLKNTANRILPNIKTNNSSTTEPQHTTQTRIKAIEVFQLENSPKLEDIPALSHKAIATIINKANHKLADSLWGNKDLLYKKSPKRYHSNLKMAAGLQPIAKDHPSLDAIQYLTTKEITTYPTHIINILPTHFEKEHSRNTPIHITLPPWQNPLNPDPCTNPTSNTTTIQHTLDY